MVKGLRSSKISTNFQLIVKERKGIIRPNGYYSVISGIIVNGETVDNRESKKF